MQCYFLKEGFIQQVMDFRRQSAEEAIDRSREMFEAVSEEFDAFELWDGEQLIHWGDRGSLSDLG